MPLSGSTIWFYSWNAKKLPFTRLQHMTIGVVLASLIHRVLGTSCVWLWHRCLTMVLALALHNTYDRLCHHLPNNNLGLPTGDISHTVGASLASFDNDRHICNVASGYMHWTTTCLIVQWHLHKGFLIIPLVLKLLWAINSQPASQPANQPTSQPASQPAS